VAKGKIFVAIDKSLMIIPLSVGSQFAFEFCPAVFLASDKNVTWAGIGVCTSSCILHNALRIVGGSKPYLSESIFTSGVYIVMRRSNFVEMSGISIT
jgi:hypothetical protein